MKFTCSIIIDQPIEKVAALFADPKNLGEYQEGFISKELVSGNEGENGAVSRLIYLMGKREMELMETITSNRLPDAFEATYEHIHMDNTMHSYFAALDENRTKYDTEIEYTAFKGFMVKIMSFLFPGMFKRQVQKWLDNFKVFAERS